MTTQHVVEVENTRDADEPVVAIKRDWEGPTVVVGSGGENILAVNSPKVVVLPFYQRDGDEDERAEALLAAAREHTTFANPQVHVVSVKLAEAPEPTSWVAMFAAPEAAAVAPVLVPAGR